MKQLIIKQGLGKLSTRPGLPGLPGLLKHLARFWIYLCIFGVLFAGAKVEAEGRKDKDLVAFYYQVFGQDQKPRKSQVSKKNKQKQKAKKDPELVAFYEQVFGTTNLPPKRKPAVPSRQRQIITKNRNNPQSSFTTRVEESVDESSAIESTQTPLSIDDKPEIESDVHHNITSEERTETVQQRVKQDSVQSIAKSASSQSTNTAALFAQAFGKNNRNKKKTYLTEEENSSNSSTSQSSDLDALFAKAFGKKKTSVPSKISVELRVNKVEQGEVTVFSNKQGQMNKVDTEQLLKLLEDIIKEHSLERIKSEISKNTRTAFKQLSKHGIKASYNPVELSLDLEINPDIRKPRVLSMVGHHKTFVADENKLSAEEVSAYLNLYSNIGQDSENNTELDFKLESSVNIKGFVFENSGIFVNNEWEAGRNTLTYDKPDKLNRYVLGDISTGNRNFQENLELKGIKFSKEFFMDPELQIRPKANESFRLKTDSEVEVYINEILQQRFYLRKGIYSLQDIGLYDGENNIRVKIKDEFGKITEKTSKQFYDSHLLKPDLSLYAINVGFLSHNETYIHDQLKDEPILSAYYQTGITKSLSLSLDAQASTNSYLLGSELIASVPLGSVKQSVALSGSSFRETGFATRFEFRPNIKRQLIGLDTLREDSLKMDTSIGQFVTGWTISGEYRSEDFSMINEVENINEESKQLKASLQTQLGFAIGYDWQGSLSLNASDYYDADKNLTARLTASKRMNNGVRWSVGAHYDSDDDFSMNLQVSIPLSKERHRRRKELSLLANSKEKSYSTKLDVYPVSLLGKDSLSGSLEYQKNENNHQQNLDLSYMDSRFEARLNAFNSGNTESGFTQSQRVKMGINSSLLCVGKNCGISRPVNDSFALVSGPSNQSQPIAINNGNSNFRYSSDNDTDLPDNYTALIPEKGSFAVVPLDSYAYQRINIDEATLPMGYDTEKVEFEVFPRYHQGYLIEAGGQPSVILDGMLVDKNKKPMSYKGGQWVSLDKQDKTIAFFSNKAGRFRITSIPPGKYKLELFDYPDMQEVQITVPDKKGEVYDTGNLVIIN